MQYFACRRIYSIKALCKESIRAELLNRTPYNLNLEREREY